MHGCKKNVSRYAGPEGPSFRVNVKQRPKNGRVGVPRNMEQCTKLVWKEDGGEDRWKLFLEACSSTSSVEGTICSG
jgi:hypothetical protein